MVENRPIICFSISETDFSTLHPLFNLKLIKIHRLHIKNPENIVLNRTKKIIESDKRSYFIYKSFKHQIILPAVQFKKVNHFQERKGEENIPRSVTSKFCTLDGFGRVWQGRSLTRFKITQNCGRLTKTFHSQVYFELNIQLSYILQKTK